MIYLVTIKNVRPHGENLSIVTTSEDIEVVANRKEDGCFRWAEGEVALYVPENTILPNDVLSERGYWDATKNKGLLGGSKGNRVKMQRFAGVESRGLLFKVELDFVGEGDEKRGFYIMERNTERCAIEFGADASAFFSATEYIPQ